MVPTDGLILRHISARLAQEPDWGQVDGLTQAGAQEPLRAGHRDFAIATWIGEDAGGDCDGVGHERRLRAAGDRSPTMSGCHQNCWRWTQTERPFLRSYEQSIQGSPLSPVRMRFANGSCRRLLARRVKLK